MNRRTPIAVSCLVSSSVTGGAELMALRAATELAGDGEFRFRFIVGGDPFAARVETAGFPVERLPLRDNADLPGLLRLIFSLRRTRPDILHLHMNRAGLLGGIAARWLGIPSLVTAAGMIHARYVKRADRILPCSRGVYQHLRSQGISPGQMTLIRNAVTIPEMEAPSPEPPRLVCVARLHPAKGHRTLIDLLALLTPEFPHLQLSCVGGGDPRLRCSLERRAARLGLANRLHFHGDCPDIRPWLRPGNLFVLASIREGLPLSVLEAMAAGLPVLAWDIPGLDEIADREAGPLLVPPGDLCRLAGRAAQLLRQPALARRLGEAGRSLVARHYSLERYGRELADVYRNLAAQSAVSSGNQFPALRGVPHRDE